MNVLDEKTLNPYLLETPLKSLLLHGHMMMVATLRLHNYQVLSCNRYFAKTFQLSFFADKEVMLFEILDTKEKQESLHISNAGQKPLINLLYKKSDKSLFTAYMYEDATHEEALLLLQPHHMDELHTIEKMSEITGELAQLTHKLKKSNLALSASRQNLISQARFSTIGEVISMLSHQWRQPLSVISSITANLEISLELDNLTNEKLLEDIQKINSVTHNLSGLINELRTLYQPNPTQKKKTPIGMITKVLKLLEPKLKELNVAVTLDNMLDASFLVDESLLQCFILVLQNSIEAFETQSTQEPQLHIYFKQKKELVLLSIKDNAGGVPEQHLKKVFEPYFSTKSLNGSGLGLFIVHAIVAEKLHGSISVENTRDGLLLQLQLPDTAYTTFVP